MGQVYLDLEEHGELRVTECLRKNYSDNSFHMKGFVEKKKVEFKRVYSEHPREQVFRGRYYLTDHSRLEIQLVYRNGKFNWFDFEQEDGVRKNENRKGFVF